MEPRIFLLGKDGVGKSALVEQYFNNGRFDNYDPTVEDVYFKKMEHEGERINLQVFDSCNFWTETNTARDKFLRECDVIIACYAIDSRESFEILKQMMSETMQTYGGTRDENRFVVAGLKSDREEHREVTAAEAGDFAKLEYNTVYFELSGRSGKEQVVDLIHHCIDRAIQRRPPSSRSGKSQSDRGGGCCLQ